MIRAHCIRQPQPRGDSVLTCLNGSNPIGPARLVECVHLLVRQPWGSDVALGARPGSRLVRTKGAGDFVSGLSSRALAIPSGPFWAAATS
jgi:hypothetical protein